MDYGSLNKNERRHYHDTVSQTHWRRIELTLLTKDGKPVRTFTGRRILGGNIQGDDTRTPAELLSMSVLDDDYAIDWRFGEHKKFKAQVVDARFVPALDDWVEMTVFTGPLWDDPERTGPAVSLVAQGSERLAMGSVRRAFHRPRKSRATAVEKDLLESAGASDKDLKIPTLPAKLPRAVTVGVRVGRRRDTNGKKEGKGKDNRPTRQIYKVTRTDTYWGEAAAIAQAIDRDLYPDGRGRFVQDRAPSKPIELSNKHLVSVPTVKPGEDGEKPNTWIILGANPKGPKKQVKATVALPAKHPLSAQSLAWHGDPYQVTEIVENPHLRRKKQAITLGKKLRDKAMSELVTYEVALLPIIPWIRRGTRFSFPVGGGRGSASAHQWTLPLGPGADPLTIGANQRSRW